MFAFLASPAGPPDLSDAESETDTSSTFSGSSRAGLQNCRRCGGGGGGVSYVSAWTQTEHVVEEAEEGPDFDDAAFALRQEAHPDLQIPAARAAASLLLSASNETADPRNPTTTCAATAAAAALAHAGPPRVPTLLLSSAPLACAPAALVSALQVASTPAQKPPIAAGLTPTSPARVNSILKNALTAASLAHSSSPRPQSPFTSVALGKPAGQHTFHAAAPSVATTTMTASSPKTLPGFANPQLTSPPFIEKRRLAPTLMATAQRNVHERMSRLESSTLPAPDKRVQALAEERVRSEIDGIARAAEEQQQQQQRRAKWTGGEGKNRRARGMRRHLGKTAKLEEKRIKDAEKAHAKHLKAQEKTTRREGKQRGKQKARQEQVEGDEEKEDFSSIFTANTEIKKKRQNLLRTLISKISQTRRPRSNAVASNGGSGGGGSGVKGNAKETWVRENHSQSPPSMPYDQRDLGGIPATAAAAASDPRRATSVGADSSSSSSNSNSNSGGDRTSSAGSRFVENL